MVLPGSPRVDYTGEWFHLLANEALPLPPWPPSNNKIYNPVYYKLYNVSLLSTSITSVPGGTYNQKSVPLLPRDLRV